MSTKTSGWNEWADKRVALYRGCTNGCRYCFARADALRFGRIKTAAEWDRMAINPKERDRKWGKVKGVVGFPSCHDITPGTMEPCAAYLAKMLAPGNRVLIVTKAHPAVVDYLCYALRTWKEQVEWRITLTACGNGLARYWEPRAPLVSDRLDALRLAGEAGYRASVAMEPFLDIADAPWFVKNLNRDYHPDSIWIGKMNAVRMRVRIETEEDRRQVERIEAGQTDENILRIVQALKGVEQVKWKDSIRTVVERHRAQG